MAWGGGPLETARGPCWRRGLGSRWLGVDELQHDRLLHIILGGAKSVQRSTPWRSVVGGMDPLVPLSSAAGLEPLLWLWLWLLRWLWLRLLLVAPVEKRKRKLVPKERRGVDVAELPNGTALHTAAGAASSGPGGAGAERGGGEGDSTDRGKELGEWKLAKRKHYTVRGRDRGLAERKHYTVT